MAIRKTVGTPLAAAVGAAFMTSVAAVPAVADATSNPFAVSELSSGYKLAAGHMEGKCGEGKCGGMESKGVKEGACGEMTPDAAAEKAKEGKCGEGKCGGMDHDAAAEKMKEGTCGGAAASEAKPMEGKCGEGKCGAK